MTKYMKWGLISRFIAVIGFVMIMGSRWWDPIASSRYSLWVLGLGFVLSFVGIFAGKGMFFFRKRYRRIEIEELERRKIGAPDQSSD